jgi:hypothetical protein
MSLGLATMITLTWVACYMSQSPFPVTIVFLAFVACSLPTCCFHDVQGTDCGDVGWALTGFFGVGSAAFTIVLWRCGDILDLPAILTGLAIVTTIGTVLTMWWYFIFRKRNKIGFD